MRIGIVTQSYYPKPGGVTEVAYHTAKHLKTRGHSVKIITTHYSGKEESSPDVIRIGRNILVPVNGAWVNVTVGLNLREKLKKIFLEENFDIIQTHCPLVPTLPLLALKAVPEGKRIVGTFHAAAESNMAYRIFQRPLEQRAERLDVRIAVSEPAARFASRYFPGSYEIVPNGIDCKRFHPDAPRMENLLDGSLNLLYVGRMDRRKGLKYLFRALPIARKRLGRKIRLILVGEGKLRGMLIPKPLRLQGVEILPLGRIAPDMLPRYYASADIFCSPATGRESFGIVLLEAMASGTPVIATDIPGFHSVVSPGRDALLVPPRDPGAIADAILEIEGNGELKKQLGILGREKALMYDWPTVIDKLERIFLGILGEKEERRIPELQQQNVG